MSSEDAQPALLNAFLLTTKDALMVFEAARRGICPVVTRRLGEGEKTKLIISGSVFAFDEQSTGIKRWTDGALWSPSRIIGNYLIYRELDKKGEKDTTRPSTQSESSSNLASPHGQTSDPFDATKQPALSSSLNTPEGKLSSAIVTGSTGLHRELERALVGSLTTSYRFKKDGLIKKTISNGHLHLISYYTIDDVLTGRLRTPSSLIELASLEISSALLDAKNFRMPPMTEKDMEGNMRYIGEESDPVGAPPILAPLLAPGSVPASRPLTAAIDGPYGTPAPGTLPPYETAESHLFAFKPVDEGVYPAPQAEIGPMDPQYQNDFQHYPQSRPDAVQPLWSSHYGEDAPPIAGPSGWREQQPIPYAHSVVHPSAPQSMHSHSHPHQLSIQPQHHFLQPEDQSRPSLQRSHSGAMSYGEQPYSAYGQRPITQFRRQSYRPPSSSYPYPPRSADPYARPMSNRPATSPAPTPGMYGVPDSFNGPRGSLSAKTEPDSPVVSPSHYTPYQHPHLQPLHRGPIYSHYAPSPPGGPSSSYTSIQHPPPPPHMYTSPVNAPQSAPPHSATAYPYHETVPPHFHESEAIGHPPQRYNDTYQEMQSAPAYAEQFQQRASYAGPVRQHLLPKIEDT